MVSTLETYKHFPDHIRHLLYDLSSEGEVVSILNTYIPYLTSDTSLYFIYLNFGFSPEHGGFLAPPNSSDIISCIAKEYHSSIPELEENCSKIISDVKNEFFCI